MGLFSNGKCPIHKVEYSVGSNYYEHYLYCKKCRAEKKAQYDREKSLERRIEELESLVKGQSSSSGE